MLKAEARVRVQNLNNGSVHTECAHIAQLVEHVFGKDEVTSSSLVVGSILANPVPQSGIVVV